MNEHVLEEVHSDERALLNYKNPFHVIKSKIGHVGSREVFVTDWGEFDIPSDVPRHFRKDGWFDRRYRKSLDQLRAYVKRQTENLMNEAPIQSYHEFLRTL